MTDLQSLAHRLEGLSGADRDVDDAVCLALGWTRGPGPTPAYRHGPYWYDLDGRLFGEVSPQVTKSLDAAVGLVERVLPRWRVALDSDHDRAPLWGATVKRSGGDWPARHFAPTAPLALLRALIQAKLEEGSPAQHALSEDRK